MATTPYAVAADVVAFMKSGTAPAEPEIDRLIQRACELLDDELVGVTYDVDANGNPTDTLIVAPALNQAVCAQIEWWTETRDELDQGAQWQQAAVEGVSLNRGAMLPRQLAPRAKRILRVAGLRTPLYPVHVP